MVAPFHSHRLHAGVVAAPNVQIVGDSIEDPFNYGQAWDSIVTALGGVKLNGQMSGNGSFETDWTGVLPAQWTVSTCTLVSDTTHALYGVKSGKMTCTTSPCYVTMGGDLGFVRLGIQSSQAYTFSVSVFFPVAAHGTIQLLALDNDGSGYAQSTGATVSPAAGWQRISVSRTFRAALTEAFVRINWTGATAGDVLWLDGFQMDTGLWSGANLPPYVGDLRSAIAGTQLQQIFSTSATAITASGNEMTDATRTTGTQGDGFTPPDSSYGIWEGTTNIVRNGGFETNITDWIAVNSATLSRDTTVHKYGTASLKCITGNVAANEGINNNFSTPITASTTYTESFWTIAPAGAVMAVVTNLYNGATFVSQVNGGTFVGTGGWQKVKFTFTTPAGVTIAFPFIYTNVRGAVTFWVDGFQIEAKSLATPYVETNGATASRAAARVQVGMTAMTQVQGWVAMCIRPQWAGGSPPGTPIVWEWGVGDFSQILNLSRSTTAWILSSTTGGSNAQAAVTATHNAGDLVTLVGYWTATQIGLSVNGGAFTVTTRAGVAQTANMPVTADIGSRTGTGLFLDGELQWYAMGAGTLIANDAAFLGTLGTTDPVWQQLTVLNNQATLNALGLGFAFPSIVWPATTVSATVVNANNGLSTFAQSVVNCSPRADILIVQKGINDFFAGTKSTDPFAVTPTTWRAAVRAFLLLCNALNPRPYVIWLGLVTTVLGPNVGIGGAGVDWATSNDDMKRQMNAITRQECMDAGVPFALIAPDMPVSMVGADNVHPTVPVGQQRVADRALQLLGVA